jgi:LacI family transcriptional regulator
MKTTIKDVAREAGVSIATVSLVIHDNERISSDTKKKVQKAIKSLSYHPSRSARGLVSQKTGNIGFILTDDHFLRTEPFYTRIFLGAEFQARSDEYYILLTTIPTNYTEEDSLPRFILEQNVDGIIIAGKVPVFLIEKLNKFNVPLVFVDFLPSNGQYPTVQIDNFHGGELATQHLIDYGHKKIGFIAGDIQHPSISARFRGFKQTLENNNIEYNSNNYIINESYPARQNGYSAAKILLANNNITAIFAANDALAIGAMQYCKDNGIKIPNDISIIGFDDVEADLLLDPPLSTVRVPKIEMGAEAMQLMVNIINKNNIIAKRILVPVVLIARESTMQVNK